MNETTMTVSEWWAEGVRRFGPNQFDWLVVCPICGHIASVAEYKAAGAPVGAVAFSCIGRFVPSRREAFGAFAQGPGPCNYAGGGLFNFNPLAIQDESGTRRLFAFADALPVVADATRAVS